MTDWRVEIGAGIGAGLITPPLSMMIEPLIDIPVRIALTSGSTIVAVIILLLVAIFKIQDTISSIEGLVKESIWFLIGFVPAFLYMSSLLF